MSVHVFAGETFAALWDGDELFVDERTPSRQRFGRDRVPGCRCEHNYTCGPCLVEAGRRATAAQFGASGVRADGELVGQLRLPDELLPVARGEMFP